MEGRVFVCHASEDAGAAQAIVERLEARGFPCWIAPRNIDAGQNYTEAILAGLRAAPLVVFVFSDSANASPHVPRELERAADHGTRILPVRVGPAEPNESLRYLIGTAHWLDAAGVAPEVWLEQLAVAAGNLLGQSPTPSVPSSPLPPPPPPRVATYPPPPPPGATTTSTPPLPANLARNPTGSGAIRAKYLVIGGLVTLVALVAIGLATKGGSDSGATDADGPNATGTEVSDGSDGPDGPDGREVNADTGLTDAEEALIDRLLTVDATDCVRAEAPGADAAVSCALDAGPIVEVASFATTSDAGDYWEAARGGLVTDPTAAYCDDGYEGPLPDTNGDEVGRIRCAAEDGGGKAVAQWVDERNDVVVTARSDGDLATLLTDAIGICCS